MLILFLCWVVHLSGERALSVVERALLDAPALNLLEPDTAEHLPHTRCLDGLLLGLSGAEDQTSEGQAVEAESADVGRDEVRLLLEPGDEAEVGSRHDDVVRQRLALDSLSRRRLGLGPDLRMNGEI